MNNPVNAGLLLFHTRVVNEDFLVRKAGRKQGDRTHTLITDRFEVLV
jgi:hypothetical protein